MWSSGGAENEVWWGATLLMGAIYRSSVQIGRRAFGRVAGYFHWAGSRCLGKFDTLWLQGYRHFGTCTFATNSLRFAMFDVTTVISETSTSLLQETICFGPHQQCLKAAKGRKSGGK